MLATDLDGLIGDFPQHGLFVGETRILSRYRNFVDGRTPQKVAVSNVEQHRGSAITSALLRTLIGNRIQVRVRWRRPQKKPSN